MTDRRRQQLRALLVALLETAAIALVAYGALLVHVAAGFITGGLLLALMAFRLDQT